MVINKDQNIRKRHKRRIRGFKNPKTRRQNRQRRPIKRNNFPTHEIRNLLEALTDQKYETYTLWVVDCLQIIQLILQFVNRVCGKNIKSLYKKYLTDNSGTLPIKQLVGKKRKRQTNKKTYMTKKEGKMTIIGEREMTESDMKLLKQSYNKLGQVNKTLVLLENSVNKFRNRILPNAIAGTVTTLSINSMNTSKETKPTTPYEEECLMIIKGDPYGTKLKKSTSKSKPKTTQTTSSDKNNTNQTNNKSNSGQENNNNNNITK